MPTGWSHPQRWTRSHERLIAAFERLHAAWAGDATSPSAFGSWLDRNFGVKRTVDLTVAQARCARRRLNALRVFQMGLHACGDGEPYLQRRRPMAGGIPGLTATATATKIHIALGETQVRKGYGFPPPIMTGEATA